MFLPRIWPVIEQASSLKTAQKSRKNASGGPRYQDSKGVNYRWGFVIFHADVFNNTKDLTGRCARPSSRTWCAWWTWRCRRRSAWTRTCSRRPCASRRPSSPTRKWWALLSARSKAWPTLLLNYPRPRKSDSEAIVDISQFWTIYLFIWNVMIVTWICMYYYIYRVYRLHFALMLIKSINIMRLDSKIQNMLLFVNRNIQIIFLLFEPFGQVTFIL